MTEVDRLYDVIGASEFLLNRASMRIPGYEQTMPFRIKVATMRLQHERLTPILEKFRELERDRDRGLTLNGNLGFPLLLTALIGGAVVGISTVGGWIYSNFTDAKTLDAQSSVYKDMRDEGTAAKDAANIVFGGGGAGSIMDKAILIAVILTGGVLAYKLIK